MKTKKLIKLAVILTVLNTSFISCDNDDQENVNQELQAIGKDEVTDSDV